MLSLQNEYAVDDLIYQQKVKVNYENSSTYNCILITDVVRVN